MTNWRQPAEWNHIFLASPHVLLRVYRSSAHSSRVVFATSGRGGFSPCWTNSVELRSPHHGQVICIMTVLLDVIRVSDRPQLRPSHRRVCRLRSGPSRSL